MNKIRPLHSKDFQTRSKHIKNYNIMQQCQVSLTEIMIMPLRRSEDQSLETGVAKWDFLEVTALYLGFQEWKEFGEREGISVRRTCMNKVRKVPSHAQGKVNVPHGSWSRWNICRGVEGKDEAGKVGWKYTVRAQMPEKEVIISYCRQWETMAKIWDK